ncbi:MAG: PD40 domain-containing protein [Bacteroidetes bacterium]|nr:PD40 domain-containing protein [Bacteroidota bacterium]
MRFIASIFLLVPLVIFSQTLNQKDLTERAEKKFKLENYEDALEDYLQLVKIDPKNEEVNYNTAVCYLNANTNKSKAIPFLENITRIEKHNPNADYLLGRAYQYANRFDEAIASFEKFKFQAKGKLDNLSDVNDEIQNCINAKELIKYPVDIVFQNLGDKINSEYADYYPFVTENESFIIYNSKRPLDKETPKNDNGQYQSSIYISKVVNGRYTESDVVNEPISKNNQGDEVIGMSPNGNIILINKSTLRGNQKLYLTRVAKNGAFSDLEELPHVINGSGDVIAATIDNDANVIYFASDRKGGFGGTDLYMCNKLPNGKWSDAKNLGVEINTPKNEDFPNLSPDGKTLYFSSKGHSSMGGYDIFKAKFNTELNKYENVKNIGYPINTTYDDYNFRISKTGRYGYLSSLRGGGMGDYDIYRILFNDVEVDYTVIIGTFATSDSTAKIDYANTYLTVSNNISNELVGNYLPNPINGRYIIILPPGKYNLRVESPGFKDIETPIEVFDKVSYQSEKSMKLTLKKKL